MHGKCYFLCLLGVAKATLYIHEYYTEKKSHGIHTGIVLEIV